MGGVVLTKVHWRKVRVGSGGSLSLAVAQGSLLLLGREETFLLPSDPCKLPRWLIVCESAASMASDSISHEVFFVHFHNVITSLWEKGSARSLW